MTTLKEKIENGTAKIAVLGLGYVGYPLACLFSRAGFKVIGYDVDLERVEKIKNGNVFWALNYRPNEKNFSVTDKELNLKEADVFIITVQTPLKYDNTPDLSYVESACEIIRKFIEKDKFVIMESTTYPKTTEEVIKPILEKSGLIGGKDFYLCFAPERIDPGSEKWGIENIPKIVGGINPKSTELGILLYSKIIKKTIPVSSARVAEAVKMMENTFRNINIALVNEIVKVFDKLDIDIWEVIDAASTKPFSFMPHYPGPGVGGHCIPKDPFYLVYKAKKEGLDMPLVELGSLINHNMPFYIFDLIENTLNKIGKKFEDSKIGILGVTYKKNVPDVRNTPAKIVIEEICKRSNDVSVFDPYTNETFGGKREDLENTIKDKDCIVLLTNHDLFRKKQIEKLINKFSPNCCIVDTRNFFDKSKFNPGIHYKCLGKP